MQLKSITIKNYRSIEDLSFEINQLPDKTFTYGLIGVNEVGKSTILRGMALKDGLKDKKGQPLPHQKDFKGNEPIDIEYIYELSSTEIEECKKHLATKSPQILLDAVDFSKVKQKTSFVVSNPGHPVLTIELLNLADVHEQKSIIQEQAKQIILDKCHKCIFWTAEDRYLISEPIHLLNFASAPDSISVPLKNCFSLAGITGSNIKNRINALANDSTEIELLQDELGEKVTKHIKTVWPKHPIDITFVINNGLINFHVKDKNAKGKAKTAEQRSDGFKQFVSFLLTISAQNKNEELTNSILLLDEPETHLHPQAQEYLLSELIKITQNERNNIVFFATHSNYMIDKNNLSRNYRITKEKDDNSEQERFDEKLATYASVNYEVFNVAGTDYHNELYGYLEYTDKSKLDGLPKTKKWQNTRTKTTEDVSLPTYIRHSIHHPENNLNTKFTNEELTQSIETLQKLRR